MTDLLPDPPSKAELDEAQRQFAAAWDAVRRITAVAEIGAVVAGLLSLALAVLSARSHAWYATASSMAWVLGCVGGLWILHLASTSWTVLAMSRAQMMAAMDLADWWREAYRKAVGR